jgi:hypothetical protein
MNRGSSVGIATTLRDGRPRNRSLIAVQARDFSLFSKVQTSSKAYLASYAMGSTGSFPGVKAAGS